MCVEAAQAGCGELSMMWQWHMLQPCFLLCSVSERPTYNLTPQAVTSTLSQRFKPLTKAQAPAVIATRNRQMQHNGRNTLAARVLELTADALLGLPVPRDPPELLPESRM